MSLSFLSQCSFSDNKYRYRILDTCRWKILRISLWDG